MNRHLAFIGFVAAVMSHAAPVYASDVYGLVVGADAYVGVTSLAGAVNDARSIDSALRRRGAREVVMLTDAQVTRAGVIAAFEGLAAKAQAGDWLVFSYAGHGGQERESLSGDERDGLDETFILPGYQDSAPQNGERLRDNDVYEMFAKVRRDVTILFIADACHSGTMTRSVDPRGRAPRLRFTNYGPVGDVLGAPPPATSGRDPRDLPNLVFAAASLESETTPELTIAGKQHGALSYFVAAAINGAADGDRDGRTTLSEFRSYVTAATRLASESRQTPAVTFLATRTNDVLPFGLGQAAPPAVSAPNLTVWSSSGAPQSVPTEDNQTDADFVWDKPSGAVVNNSTGDVVATVDDDQGVASVVEKWRVLPPLKALAAQSPLEVTIGPDGAGVRYTEGRVAEIVVSGNRGVALAYLTVINLAGDGTVQTLFPAAPNSSEAEALPSGSLQRFDVKAGPPFGADHVIAIATAERPDALRQKLGALEGQRASRQAADIIRSALTGQSYALGLAGLYTGPN